MAAASGNQIGVLAKEYAALEPVVLLIRKQEKLLESKKNTQGLLSDSQGMPEMEALIQEELEQIEASLGEIEKDITVALLPKDEAEEKDVILEIRGGTGGDEAALFAADLFSMYTRYADRHKWRVSVISSNLTAMGGYKEIIAEISGKGVYAHLRFESGVHRVQRIPATETNGRIHTSAATVAVLPAAEDIDVEIFEKDLRIDTFRAQGAGGQHVNTTDSAVRILHVPTGVISECQDERSQHRNRDKAMKMLRTRIYDQQRREQAQKRADDRRSQVGTGDRSERIRTYNFPQGRVTDHRVGLTIHNLEGIFSGELEPVITVLRQRYQEDLLGQHIENK